MCVCVCVCVDKADGLEKEMDIFISGTGKDNSEVCVCVGFVTNVCYFVNKLNLG
jgi:hypothetical protein